ncbi:hypothetical protein QJS66_11535 [Kocuria rhizophila]|nr:hypothetical protein QJS66_11535 [Kocuria rhizophila]
MPGGGCTVAHGEDGRDLPGRSFLARLQERKRPLAFVAAARSRSASPRQRSLWWAWTRQQGTQRACAITDADGDRLTWRARGDSAGAGAVDAGLGPRRAALGGRPTPTSVLRPCPRAPPRSSLRAVWRTRCSAPAPGWWWWTTRRPTPQRALAELAAHLTCTTRRAGGADALPGVRRGRGPRAAAAAYQELTPRAPGKGSGPCPGRDGELADRPVQGLAGAGPDLAE